MITATRPAASPRQVAFYGGLLAECDTLAASLAQVAASEPETVAAAADRLATLTRWQDVRDAIDSAIALRDTLRRQARALAPAPTAAAPVTGEAVAVAKGDVLRLEDGTVVRVKLSQTGNLYAMARGPQDTAFSYAAGILRRMTGARRLTMAEALELSAAWGECVRCGRTLTASKSVAAGIGPVCRKAFDA